MTNTRQPAAGARGDRSRSRAANPAPRARRVAVRGPRGGALVGFLAGLIVGLGIAVIVALFVTRAPVPFVNKSDRAAERPTGPRAGDGLPDPNDPLQANARDSSLTSPAPGEPGSMASLPPPGVAGSAASSSAAPGGESAPADGGYVVQAGAFRSADDAEGMKARLALLGLEARVVTADVGGQTMYRVRIGPFAQQGDASRARDRLVDGGIDAAVVRQR